MSPQPLTIADLRSLARKRLPKAVLDYIDGGADAEWTLRENTRYGRRSKGLVRRRSEVAHRGKRLDGPNRRFDPDRLHRIR